MKKGDKDYEDKDTNISLIEKFKDSGQNWGWKIRVLTLPRLLELQFYKISRTQIFQELEILRTQEF